MESGKNKLKYSRTQKNIFSDTDVVKSGFFSTCQNDVSRNRSITKNGSFGTIRKEIGTDAAPSGRETPKQSNYPLKSIVKSQFI